MITDDTQSRIEKLEKRLDELESVREIEKLQQQYVRDLAERNWQGIADAYSDDAICDIRLHGVHHGKDSIEKMFASDLQDVVVSNDGYVLSSPDITVDGDTAYGEWIWHRFQCEFKTAFGMMRIWGPWSEGLYKCHYARIDGVWKIQNLWFRVLRPDADDEVVAQSPQAVIGGGLLDRDPVKR